MLREESSLSTSPGVIFDLSISNVSTATYLELSVQSYSGPPGMTTIDMAELIAERLGF